MSQVVPTVNATSPSEYAEMLTRVESLSDRLHIDICDGKFADHPTIGLGQVHVNEQTLVDFHLMVVEPELQLQTALSHNPHLIIFHAEAAGDLEACIDHTKELGVKAGLALLPETQPEEVQEIIAKVDHVLIFTGGALGHNSGPYQPENLGKVGQVKKINPKVEVSVDGGVSDQNAAQIVSAGVDILYAGGFIQNAQDPQEAYSELNKEVQTAL